MRKWLGFLLVLISITSFGQTEGVKSSQAVSSAGTMYYYAAVGFDAAPVNRKMIVYNWPGVSTNSEASLYAQYPMKLFDDGWNGKTVLAPGDTLYWLFVSALSTETTCDDFCRQTNYIFLNWLDPADTAEIKSTYRTAFVGYSGGAANISLPITNFCFDGSNPLDVRYRFKKFVTAATGTHQNLSTYQTYGPHAFLWAFCDVDDNLYNNTVQLYDNFALNTTASIYSVKESYPDVGANNSAAHAAIDDYVWSTLNGTTANDNVRLWLHDTAYGLITSYTKIDIHPLDIKEVIGGGNALNLFDEDLDPMNGEDDLPSTAGIPGTRQYYFEHTKGSADTMWWFDVDLRGLHHLDRVSFGVPSSFFGDSVFVFLGYYHPDSANLNGIFRRAWEGYIDEGTNEWVHADIDDTSQIVRIGIKGAIDPDLQIASAPDIREIVLYGSGLDDRLPAPPDTFEGTYPGYQTFSQQSGVNDNQGYTNWRFKSHYRYIRRGDQFDWAMDGASDTINLDKFNAASLGYKYTRRGYLDSAVNILGLISYEMIHKTPYWLTSQGEPSEGYMYNLVTDDIFKASSYTRVGYFFWQRAAMDGFTPHDTTLLKVKNAQAYTADSTTWLVENNNEIEGTWRGSQNCVGCTFRYWSNTQYNAYSQVTYDGHEGRYGPRIGSYVADTNQKFIMAATADLSWRYVNARDWLTRKTRTDGRNYFYGEAQHHYLSDDISQGIHPMQDSVRDEWRDHIDHVQRIAPGLKTFLNEYGAGANNSEILTVRDSVFTPREKQANTYLWYQVMASQTHIYSLAKYTFTFNAPDANNGLFQTHGEYKSYDAVEEEAVEFPEATNYVGRQFYQLCGNFQYDSSYSETYGWNINNKYRYWKVGSDSLIYLVGRPNNTGATSTLTLAVGSNKVAVHRVFSYTDMTYTDTPLTVTGGNVDVEVSDKIGAVIVTNINSTPVHTRMYRNNVIRSN